MNTRTILMYILLLILAYFFLTAPRRAQADADQASIQGISIISPAA